MPDAPPGGDDGHSAEPIKKIEYEDEAKAGILDAGFQGDSSGVGFAYLVPFGPEVAHSQGGTIMDRDQDKNEVQIPDDIGKIAVESKYDKAQKDNHGKPLDGAQYPGG